MPEKEHSEIKNAKIDSFDAGFENGRIVIKMGFTFAIGGLNCEESFGIDAAGGVLSDILRITEAKSLSSIVGSPVRLTVEKGIAILSELPGYGTSSTIHFFTISEQS